LYNNYTEDVEIMSKITFSVKEIEELNEFFLVDLLIFRGLPKDYA